MSADDVDGNGSLRPTADRQNRQFCGVPLLTLKCGRADYSTGVARKNHLVSAGLLVAAAVCFVIGISAGSGSAVGGLLIVVAAISEFRFWRRIRRPVTR